MFIYLSIAKIYIAHLWKQ